MKGGQDEWSVGVRGRALMVEKSAITRLFCGNRHIYIIHCDDRSNDEAPGAKNSLITQTMAGCWTVVLLGFFNLF